MNIITGRLPLIPSEKQERTPLSTTARHPTKEPSPNEQTNKSAELRKQHSRVDQQLNSAKKGNIDKIHTQKEERGCQDKLFHRKHRNWGRE
eukprot:m.128395 g.128395  ORF g.128395 m.128395 type:complete len:91 (-) comp13026_c0_seq9:2391-2663(-)